MLLAVFVIARSFLRVPYGLIINFLSSILTVAGNLVRSFFKVPSLPFTVMVFSSFVTVKAEGTPIQAKISSLVYIAYYCPPQAFILGIMVRRNPSACRYKKYSHIVCR